MSCGLQTAVKCEGLFYVDIYGDVQTLRLYAREQTYDYLFFNAAGLLLPVMVSLQDAWNFARNSTSPARDSLLRPVRRLRLKLLSMMRPAGRHASLDELENRLDEFGRMTDEGLLAVALMASVEPRLQPPVSCKLLVSRSCCFRFTSFLAGAADADALLNMLVLELSHSPPAAHGGEARRGSECNRKFSHKFFGRTFCFACSVRRQVGEAAVSALVQANFFVAACLRVERFEAMDLSSQDLFWLLAKIGLSCFCLGLGFATRDKRDSRVLGWSGKLGWGLPLLLLVLLRTLEVATMVAAINFFHFSLRWEHLKLGGPTLYVALAGVAKLALPEAGGRASVPSVAILPHKSDGSFLWLGSNVGSPGACGADGPSWPNLRAQVSSTAEPLALAPRRCRCCRGGGPSALPLRPGDQPCEGVPFRRKARRYAVIACCKKSREGHSRLGSAGLARGGRRLPGGSALAQPLLQAGLDRRC